LAQKSQQASQQGRLAFYDRRCQDKIEKAIPINRLATEH